MTETIGTSFSITSAEHGLLLFAFHSDNMVGHIFLRLEPAEEPELREGLPKYPFWNGARSGIRIDDWASDSCS